MLIFKSQTENYYKSQNKHYFYNKRFREIDYKRHQHRDNKLIICHADVIFLPVSKGGGVGRGTTATLWQLPPSTEEHSLPKRTFYVEWPITSQLTYKPTMVFYAPEICKSWFPAECRVTDGYPPYIPTCNHARSMLISEVVGKYLGDFDGLPCKFCRGTVSVNRSSLSEYGFLGFNADRLPIYLKEVDGVFYEEVRGL